MTLCMDVCLAVPFLHYYDCQQHFSHKTNWFLFCLIHLLVSSVDNWDNTVCFRFALVCWHVMNLINSQMNAYTCVSSVKRLICWCCREISFEDSLRTAMQHAGESQESHWKHPPPPPTTVNTIFTIDQASCQLMNKTYAKKVLNLSLFLSFTARKVKL